MRIFLHYWFFAIIIGFLSLFFSGARAQGLPAVEARGNGNLVSVQWLEKNLNLGNIVLLDASAPSMYAAKHIAGAISVDIFSIAARNASAEEFEKRLQAWGANAGNKIVIYDQGATFLATTLFYELHYHGVPAENLTVLDGGLAKWQAVGGKVTKDPTPAPAPGSFRIGKPNEDVRSKLPAFLVASGDPTKHALVESLDSSYYVGETKFFDRAGHIPNAISMPNEDFFNADKTFKSPVEIARMFRYYGIRPDQQIHSYCGGGQAATVTFFAAKYVLNYPNVSVYKGSQHEWLRDERGLPFWTYAAPNILRDKQWLSGWTSPMLRAFGFSNISIVDVRPAEAFDQGHLPASTNLAVDGLKSMLAKPDSFADTFSAARINALDEAVVVSEGGVTPRAALAYLMLESAGQKKVSILVDSVDEWALSGLPLNRPDTAQAAALTEATSTAKPPKPYQASARLGLVLSEPPRTPGLYERVYLASGKSVASKIRDGRVIHVHYASLLNADNTPKAAKDIWAILTKAGVPRYAEIICVADDTGDAAVNYVLLKMMGYPDVKVLVS